MKAIDFVDYLKEKQNIYQSEFKETIEYFPDYIIKTYNLKDRLFIEEVTSSVISYGYQDETIYRTYIDFSIQLDTNLIPILNLLKNDVVNLSLVQKIRSF